MPLQGVDKKRLPIQLPPQINNEWYLRCDAIVVITNGCWCGNVGSPLKFTSPCNCHGV